jgi:hypothetical protein
MVYKATADWAFVSTREVEIPATRDRPARKAMLSLRFGEVTIKRPDRPGMKHLPKTTTLRLVEALERDPPEGVEAIHWRLFTTHAVDDIATSWLIVGWYRMRWVIDIDQTWRLSRIKCGRVGVDAEKQGATEWQGCRAGGFELGDCHRICGDELVEGSPHFDRAAA